MSSYYKYREEMCNSWRIYQPIHGAIKLGREATDYITFETSVVHNFKNKPYYYALANYACFRLWPEMCRYLKTQMGDQWKASVYWRWIEDNDCADDGTASYNKLADLIEHCKSRDSEFDEVSAQNIVRRALEFEVSFFNAATLTPQDFY